MTPSTGKRIPQKKLSEHIGTTCREARLRLGLTQEDVAERVGYAKEVYGRMERGDMLPSVPSLRIIACVLGISPDKLLDIDRTAPNLPLVEPQEQGTPATRRLMRIARELTSEQVRTLITVANAFTKKNDDSESEPTPEE